jgi:hypothetical protein
MTDFFRVVVDLAGERHCPIRHVIGIDVKSGASTLTPCVRLSRARSTACAWAIG